MQTVGFIGLGTMGRPMAERLIGAGYEVRLNRVKAESQYLVELGGKPAQTADEAVSEAEIVVLMLPDTSDVEEVLFGQNGVADAIRADALLIDMSSISPLATRDFASRIAVKGAHYLDAPVSGGEIGARNGTLSIMVGGDEAQFERARPLFERLGKNITHIGEVGSGQVVKIANQIVVGLAIEAVGEAFLLAERAGVSLDKVRDALMGGFAQSRVLEVHGRRMIETTFDPGFALRLHRKDLNLAIEAARTLEIALPNTAATLQLMNAALSQGEGARDHSVLYRSLCRLSAPVV